MKLMANIRIAVTTSLQVMRILSGSLLLVTPAMSQTPKPADAIDTLFASVAESPGCVVGVEDGDRSHLVRAYGWADLERRVKIAPETIFEAGSVSKQFTAAAILLLVQDGRIALTDDIRKYLPELPAYGRPITIDHLLTHSSGLRDWGDVAEMAGWPRGDRVYSSAEALRIAGLQRELNHQPGGDWSYTNTGYTLLTIVLQRVSGQSMQAFSQQRIFGPLGMKDTQWRDDFRRVVVRRAVAYRSLGASYELQMPAENAIGHGGLLTTIGDLLIWDRALASGALGRQVTDALQRPAKLNDGRTLAYARGLMVSRFHGYKEVAHSGATAGYRAWLARYPDTGLSVALLCNNGDDGVVTLGRAIAALYLPEKSSEPVASPQPPIELAGWYRNLANAEPLHLSIKNDVLRGDGGETLERMPDGSLRFNGEPAKVGAGGRLTVLGLGGQFVTFIRAPMQWFPGKILAAAKGHFHSNEASATVEIAAVDGKLRVTAQDRPGLAVDFAPAYENAFVNRRRVIRLLVDKAGRVTGLIMSADRVWRLPFRRVP
ncbi:serine hydrolase domain-containing protein (plasmid) [Sphingobium sp. SJ10-10]|uniref:serine hydrolase domain-containing protein n=1 Tax=Sphingobium sp. SJ10-10 TaxID=3114999 RepID=UPI002E19EAC9|nr:serine hydrolase domain-containing protein [Sphingobium sp. SJ10-10]